jgi:asparagine synthase (glutamine-hydrolysing)
MSGICGWLGRDRENASEVIVAMRSRMTWPGHADGGTASSRAFGLGALGARHTACVLEHRGLHVALHGHPRWQGDSHTGGAIDEVGRRLADDYLDQGPDAIARLLGDFSVALLDPAKHEAVLAVDRTGTRNLVYRDEGDALAFAATLDALAAHPGGGRKVSPQAIYDYIYFHMVPGPATMFEGTHRLPPGHCLVHREGRSVVRPYWEMRYVEDLRAPEEALAREFLGCLESAVRDAAAGARCGTFLSGGTDSSTVTGFLSRISESPVDSFSIGFDAAGYDEMSYARIAAQRYRTNHHEYYVTPSDVAEAIPLIAAEYDQPFGNSSAVPTYFCARLASEHGVERLLGGDGGDELFGGNARYARQHVFALYERIPGLLRERVIEPLTSTSLAQSLPLVRKASSYVAQARQPMPGRYESYNLLERIGAEQLFVPDFLASVDRREPLAGMSKVWNEAHASTLINRMLALDLRYTLADNDLPKVTRTCDRAGVDVAFPLLDDAVVAFSARLAPSLKLRGTTLRYFFKRALKDVLPVEIVRKKKHGFGLPVGPWIASDPRLRSLAGDALASLGRRGIIRQTFLDDLLTARLQEHPGYYGALVWVLMMLELWFARQDARP